MYNSIYFETLQLHASQEVDSHTLSKTIAVYQNDFYIFHKDNIYESARGIRITIKGKSNEAKGRNTELYSGFTWHLN